MTDSTPPPAGGAQRVKLALIPLLVLILAWVLYDRGGEPAPPPAALADGYAAPPAAAGPHPQHARSRASAPPQEMTLADVLAHNPFALPPALDPSAAARELDSSSLPTQPVASVAPDPNPAADARRRARLEELQRKQVSVIHHGPAGPTAVIDGRTHRVGDFLDGGLRIVEIGPHGVLVEVHDVH